MHFILVTALLHLAGFAIATCDSPSPAFLLPDFDRHASFVDRARTRVFEAISALIQREEYNKTSFSVEITSQTTSLFDFHHTAEIRSTIRRGAEKITNETNYRIASITKPFTVLALLQLQKQGKLDLDASILTYVPELNVSQSGSLPWKDITIRALASQIAGIPRDLAQDDLVTDPDLAALLGLPKVSRILGPTCDSLVNYTRFCNATDLLSYVKGLEPVFAPNQKSSYSNINYDLLGLVIANISGTSYEDYVGTQILREIGMNGSSFTTPPDAVAAVPAGIEYYWPLEVAVQNPTGGLYSSTADMSRFLRYVLSTYNAQALGVNWFNPLSFSGSINTFYGMPWEIFRKRTVDISPELESTRPLTFITKSGGLPGYTSDIILIPEYALGFTVLVAGNGKAMSEIREIVTKELVLLGEQAAAAELAANYAGAYQSANRNMTLVLAHSKEHGLYVRKLVTNGVDTLRGIAVAFGHEEHVEDLVVSVVPTLLFKNEKNQEGERWRMLPQFVDRTREVFNNFCVADWDFYMFNGKPLNEIVFWKKDSHGNGSGMNKVVLTGFRTELAKKKPSHDGLADGNIGKYTDDFAQQHTLGDL